ncbi:MAG: hypothetical protein KDK39_13750 [Leptospiraceae bacterium]|nr:hypothetical protein [Leptospiraceae bacterium]
MTDSIFDQILIEREIVNERRVAYARMFLASFGVIDLLSFFQLIPFNLNIQTSSLILSFYLLLYSGVIFIIVRRNTYFRYLKYCVIALDYSYVVLSFTNDPALQSEPTTIVWFAFAAVVVFFLINLVRYSSQGTLFAGILTFIVYYGVTFYLNVPLESIFQISLPILIIVAVGYAVISSNKKIMIEANTKKMMERYLPPQLIGEL